MELSALALQLAGLEPDLSLHKQGEFDQQSVACTSVISIAASTSTSLSSGSSASTSSQPWSAEERFVLQRAIDQCNTRRVPWKQVSAISFSHSRSDSQLRAMNNYMRGKITKPHDVLTNTSKRIYYCTKCKQPKRSPHQCAFVL